MDKWWWWFLIMWIACGVQSYFLGMYLLRRRYPNWFNEQRRDRNRRFCGKMALMGPFNLIVLLVMLITSRDDQQ